MKPSVMPKPVSKASFSRPFITAATNSFGLRFALKFPRQEVVDPLGEVDMADGDHASSLQKRLGQGVADASRTARYEHGIVRELYCLLLDYVSGYPIDCANSTRCCACNASCCARPVLSQLWNHAANPCAAANRYTLAAMRPVSTK